MVNKAIIQKNDSLTHTIAKLNEQIDYKQSLLEDYDRLSSTYSMYITILLGLFAVFGVLTYLLTIRPLEETKKEAQELLKDIRTDMNKLFSKYTIKYRDDLIDNTLTQLENNLNGYKKNARIDYLDSFVLEGFNDKQVLRIIKLHKKEPKGRIPFVRLLLFKENVFSTDFFYNELINLSSIAHLSMNYATDFNKEEFLHGIARFLIASENLMGYINSMKEISFSYTIKIYNNDEFVNSIDYPRLIGLITSDDNNKAETIEEKTNRQNSKLYKKYLEVKPL